MTTEMLQTINTNWFKLDICKSKPIQVDFKQFSEMAKNHITSYKMEKDEYLEKYVLQDLKPVFDEKMFEKICKVSKEITKNHYPILTFHGTSSPQNINSIVKNGYLMPYERCPDTGFTIPMSHGRLYGDGIYSSQDFKVAWCHSFKDDVKELYLIINLVVLGNIDYVYKPDREGIITPIDDVYKDEKGNSIHTRIIPNTNKIQSASAKYIFPLYIATYHSSYDWSKMKNYFVLNRTLYNFSDQEPKIRDLETKENKLPIIKLNRVVDDIYSINISKKVDLSHYLMVPTSLRNNVKAISYLKNLCNGLYGTKKLYLHDKTINSYSLEHADSLYNHLITTPPSNVVYLEKSLSYVLDKITKNNDNSGVSIVYLILNNQDTLEEKFNGEFFNALKKYVQVKRIILKIIGINCDVQVLEKLIPIKNCFTTEEVWEELYHEVDTDDEVGFSNTFDKLLDENKNISDSVSLSVYNHILGNGFIDNLMEVPVWKKNVHSPVLFKGTRYSLINIDNTICKIEFDDTIDIITASNAIVSLLSKIRNNIVDRQVKLHQYVPIITKLVDGINMNIAKQKDTFTIHRLTLIRRFLHQITTLMGEITTLASVQFTGKYFNNLNKMKYKRNIVKRSKNCVSLSTADVEKIINSTIKGYGIRTRITAASEIEPWQLNIEYISKDKFDIGTIYRNAELEQEIKDSSGEIITDIIPEFQEDGTLLSVPKAYYAYLFTRNPYLYISSQIPSLYTNGFVKMADMFFKSKEKKLEDLMKILQMLPVVRNLTYIKGRTDIIDSIVKNPDNFEVYLTDARDVSSPSIILGLLCLDKGKEIYESKIYSQFCFALLAESIMRVCRAHTRSTNNDSIDQIRKITGIDPAMDYVGEFKFNMTKACVATNKILLNNYTNVSPWAIIMVLELLERYHRKEEMKQIHQDFMTTISTKAFLNRHFRKPSDNTTDPVDWGRKVQIALFLQGLRYNKARLRDTIKFTDPDKIIGDITNEQLESIKRLKKLAEMVKTRYQKRRLKKLEEAQKYKEYHTVPLVFNHAQVSDMNLKRPRHDQLELMPNGLLKHHCCYVKCPDYLKNFQTENDKKNNTRQGLFGHFQYEYGILNEYLNGFHNLASKLIRSGCNLEQFKKEINHHYKNNPRFNAEREEKDIIETWNTYKAIV